MLTASTGPGLPQLSTDQLVRHVRDALIVGDVSTGQIVLWNKAAEALFGYTAAEAIGMPLEALVPDSLKARHLAGIANYVQTGHGSLVDGGAPVELPARHKTGQQIWIELTLSPIGVPDRSEALVLAVVRDASTRKQREAERRGRLAALSSDVGAAVAESPTLAGTLQRSAEALVQHLDAAFARIWTLNESQQMLELQASAGLYTHLDGTHSRVPVGQLKIGLIAQEQRPHLTNDVLHDEQVSDKDWATRERMVAFAGYPLLVERRVVGVLALFARHSLEQEVLDELGRVADLIAQCVERKLAEHALRQSDERFRKLIERSSDMITLHRADGTITYVSPSTRSLLGYEPDDLLDQSLLKTIHPEDRAALGQVIANLVAAPGESSVARYRMRHVDGSWRWIESTGTNMLDEPAVGAIVVNRRDVTAEVEAHLQLERRVSERTRELATLLEVLHGMGSTLELQPLIGFIFDQLKTVVDYSALGLHLEIEGEFRTIEYRGPLPRDRMLANRNSPRIVDIIRSAAEQRRPVILEDFGGATPLMQRFEAEGIVLPPEAYGHARAVMCAPLISKGEHIGGLMLMHRVPGYYTPRHAEYVVAFAQQAATAIENARLYEAVHDKAALEERQRLARELHDSVSQALYAIALNSAAVEESLSKQDGRRAKRLVKQVRQLARGGLAEMRALIFELRAESLAEEGLVAALIKQAAAIEARHELELRLTLETEPALSLPAKEALYRIAQEALHNVVKHANARTAELSLQVLTNQVELTVQDHGSGFDPDGSFPGHLGLRSMRERAEAIGGSLDVRSTPEVGTTVRVRVPVASTVT